MAGTARRGRARRAQPARRAGGAVRRPRRRAPPAQGPVPRHGARGPAAAGVGHRARRASARAGWRGSSRSTSTASSRTSTGTAAARPPTARASPSGRWARWSAERAGLAETRRRGDHPRARSPRPSRSTSPTTTERALGRAGAAGAARPRRRRPSAVATQLFAAWRMFFERIADQGTVVLVFEDLHWADSGLLDFIDHLLDWTKACRSTSSRWRGRSCIERRPDWGAGKRNFTSMLPRAAARRRHARAARRPRARVCPSRRVDAIVARADGIPLYAVETVRMLVADGRLVLERRRRTGRPAISTTLAVPETLTALIASRLDGLDPPTGRSSRTPRCSARASPSAALAAVSGDDRDGARAAAARARPARAPDAQGRSALAGARPVRVRAGAHPRGRVQHARAARPEGRATSPPRATSKPSAPTSWPARWPATTSRRTQAPRVPRLTRSPPRRASRCGARLNVQRAGFLRAGGCRVLDQALPRSRLMGPARAELLLAKGAWPPPKGVSRKRRTLVWGRHSPCGEGTDELPTNFERPSPWRSHTPQNFKIDESLNLLEPAAARWAPAGVALDTGLGSLCCPTLPRRLLP